MVKAVRVHAYGAPDVLKLENLDLPAPAAGEALVRIRAAGVNFIDTYFRTGAYKAPQLPFTPGAEAAGDVIAIGDGVTHVAVGDRVAFVGSLGCYAEQGLFPAERLIKLPDAVGYDTAAAAMLKGLTAQYLLHQTFKVQAGDTILVHAAAGGVGQILCQWGKALGATVIGTAGSQDKADLAKSLGADHVILYREEDFPARVKELTGGKLCHVVYDGVGKATFPASLDCLRPLGMFVSFGSASGKIEQFDIGILAPKGSLFATRPTLATYTADPANLRSMAESLMTVLADGRVRIPVNRVAPLDEVAAIHRALEARDTTGSVILTV